MIDSKQGLHLLRGMVRIRRFEEACAEQYSAGNIRGFLHLYIGEEAIAVGVMENLRLSDTVFATYREHGHALARGLTAKSIMAEMYGMLQGCCRGRGGSMHLFNSRLRFLGGNAIVAGALPLAVGTALATKMQEKDDISVCFFGEGAIAEGEFHESMNLAQLWHLPVLFICENNLYAMGTSLNKSESETNLVNKAKSYKVDAASIDGMDIIQVYQQAAKIIPEIRQRSRPFFLECKTFRFRAHSMFDPELYRDKKEVEHWQHRDPIKLFSQYLIDQDLIDEQSLETIDLAVKAEISEAINYAEQGSPEPLDQMRRFVYSEKGGYQ